jgi:hypothetical protein
MLSREQIKARVVEKMTSCGVIMMQPEDFQTRAAC